MAHVRMRWKAANYAYQYPILICERAVLPLYPSFAQPTMITTNGPYSAPLRIEHSGVLLTHFRLVRPVSKVVVVREPPSRVEEKVRPSRRVCLLYIVCSHVILCTLQVPFSAVVGVYDADGKPLEGKYVMAQISLFGTLAIGLFIFLYQLLTYLC